MEDFTYYEYKGPVNCKHTVEKTTNLLSKKVQSLESFVEKEANLVSEKLHTR